MTFDEYFEETYGLKVWDAPLELYNKAKREYRHLTYIRTFRVYFNDENQKLFEAYDDMAVAEYAVTNTKYLPADIIKIEEVKK